MRLLMRDGSPLRRSNRAGQWVAAAVVVLGCGVAACSRAVSADPRSTQPIAPTNIRGAAPQAFSFAAPQPSPPIRGSTGSSTAAPVFAMSDGLVMALALNEQFVFALVSGDRNSRGARLHRWNRTTGELQRSERLSGGAALLLAGGSVWVAGGTAFAGGEPPYLYQMSALTLQITRRTVLASPPTALSGSSDGVWVGAGPHLYLFDRMRGEKLTHLLTSSDVVALSMSTAGGSPSGEAMYVAQRAAGGDLLIERRQGSSGEVLSARQLRASAGQVSLMGTASGVWLGYSVGGTGLLLHLESRDLQPSASLHSASGVFGASGTARPFISHGRPDVLWITDSAAGTLGCADSGTGRVLRTWMLAGSGPTVADRAGAFVASGNVLLALGPTAECSPLPDR